MASQFSLFFGNRRQMGILLLHDRPLDTLLLGQRDPWLVTLSDHEDVADSGGKGVADSVLNVDDVEAAKVALSVDDGADTADIVTAGDQDNVTRSEMAMGNNFSGFEVIFDGVIHLNIGVWVADGPSIVCGEIGDLVGAECLPPDLQQFKLSLRLLDLLEDESSLDVVHDSVVLLDLGKTQDVYATSKGVSAG